MQSAQASFIDAPLSKPPLSRLGRTGNGLLYPVRYESEIPAQSHRRSARFDSRTCRTDTSLPLDRDDRWGREARWGLYLSDPSTEGNASSAKPLSYLIPLPHTSVTWP